MPTHPTFSTDSLYAKDPELAKKYIKLAGSWSGEEYIPGEAERSVQQDSKGGDAGQGPEAPVETSAGAPVPQDGPRIVINPSVFHDDKDALCVAFNEAFRIIMEVNGFNPVSEPTQKQRRFFADTAYSQDELQMRRTILARIATFDTSVSDPTNEQLQETIEFLNTVLEIGAPQNEFEENAVNQILEVLTQVEQRGVQTADEPPEAPSAPDGENAVQADEGGGSTEDDENQQQAEAQAPQAEAQAPQAEAQAPQAEAQAPQAEAQAPAAPQAEAQAPQAEAQAPAASQTETQAPAAPQTETQAPAASQAEAQAPAAPQAEAQAPQAEAQAPQAEAQAPAAPQTETQAPAAYLLSEPSINKADRLGALDRLGLGISGLYSLKADQNGRMTVDVGGSRVAASGLYLTRGGENPSRSSGYLRLTGSGTVRSAAERPSGMSEADFKKASDADIIRFTQDRSAKKLERALMRANRSGNWTRVRKMLTDKSNRASMRFDVLDRGRSYYNTVMESRGRGEPDPVFSELSKKNVRRRKP